MYIHDHSNVVVFQFSTYLEYVK